MVTRTHILAYILLIMLIFCNISCDTIKGIFQKEVEEQITTLPLNVTSIDTNAIALADSSDSLMTIESDLLDTLLTELDDTLSEIGTDDISLITEDDTSQFAIGESLDLDAGEPPTDIMPDEMLTDSIIELAIDTSISISDSNLLVSTSDTTGIEIDTTEFESVELGELVSDTLTLESDYDIESPSNIEWRSPFETPMSRENAERSEQDKMAGVSVKIDEDPNALLPQININEFALVGIIELENEKKAIIMVNDVISKGQTRILRVGDQIKGATVVSITDMVVRLQVEEYGNTQDYDITFPQNKFE